MLKAREQYCTIFSGECKDDKPASTPSDSETDSSNAQYHFKSPLPTCYSNFMIYRTYRVGFE